MYLRIEEMFGNDTDDLPDTLMASVDYLDAYWGLWVIWRATDRRHLPSQLVKEDERLMAALLELDGVYDRIARQKAKKTRDSDNDTALEDELE